MSEWKRVTSTIVIGQHGPCVRNGYTEIGGLRFYDDQLVVGRYGEYVLRKGGVGIATTAQHSETQ